jgi:hypothetical protein
LYIVNVAKTKVVVFRNGRLRPNECWTYRDHVIKIVDHFNYLGLVFNYNGNYSLAEKTLLGQVRKARFALRRASSMYKQNVLTELYLFDTYISPIINYGCEIWGSSKSPNIERVHLKYCKQLLGVSMKTTGSMVYNDWTDWTSSKT